MILIARSILRAIRPAAILLGVALLASAQQPDAGEGIVYTPLSLSLELNRLEQLLRNAPPLPAEIPAEIRDPVLNQLPEEWAVESPEGRFLIPTERLRELLTEPLPPLPDGDAAAAGDRAEELSPTTGPAGSGAPAAARIWLSHMSSRLLQYENAPEVTAIAAGDARSALTEILARTEFRGVAPPNQWELFLQRVQNWIGDFIRRVLSFAAAYPTASRALFWILAAGAVVFVGILLFRLWRRDSAPAAAPVASMAEPVYQGWQAWLRAARDAREVDPREAVRCCYWAGVAWLQQGGALPKHLTATPRECLKLLASPRRSSATNIHTEPLRNLTRVLERVWYAGRVASPEDVQASFRDLEALGCPLE